LPLIANLCWYRKAGLTNKMLLLPALYQTKEQFQETSRVPSEGWRALGDITLLSIGCTKGASLHEVLPYRHSLHTQMQIISIAIS